MKRQFQVHDSKPYTNWVKRLFDLAIVVPSVIILSPLLVLIGFVVCLKIGSPVLFRQVRPGLHGKPFTIYKFLTMTNERDKDGNLLPDGERISWNMDPDLLAHELEKGPERILVSKAVVLWGIFG